MVDAGPMLQPIGEILAADVLLMQRYQPNVMQFMVVVSGWANAGCSTTSPAARRVIIAPGLAERPGFVRRQDRARGAVRLTPSRGDANQESDYDIAVF
jgi:hypothetical protein